MRLSIALFGCLAVSGTALADDDDVKEHAHVESVWYQTAYVGQPIRLWLSIQYDEAYFKEHAIPLFLQHLDVPIKIDAPWLREWKGTVPYDDGWDGAATPIQRRARTIFIAARATTRGARSPSLTTHSGTRSAS